MLLIGTKRVDRSGVILSRALSRRYLGNTIGLPMPEEGSMSAVPARFSPGSGQLCETSAAAALLMFWTALERPDHGFVAGGAPAAKEPDIERLVVVDSSRHVERRRAGEEQELPPDRGPGRDLQR